MSYAALLHDADHPELLLSTLRDNLDGSALRVNANVDLLDLKERDGIANMMGAFGARQAHLLCDEGDTRAIYAGNTFASDLINPNSVVLTAVSEVADTHQALGVTKLALLFMFEWDSHESVRFMSGSVGDFRTFLRVNMGWQSARISLARGHIQEDPFDPLLFNLALGRSNG